MAFLTLGPIIFSGFELPDSLPFGGEQMLVVKKLVGGDRVIDAMGRDDAELEWSGRFRADVAEARAAEIDFLRIQGQPLVLAWSSRRYNVIIRSFKPDFRQSIEIPYTIACTVLSDLTAPIAAIQPDVDASIFGDVNGAGVLAGQINIAAITSAVAGVASAANAVAKFSGANAGQVAGVQTSIQTALGVVNSQQVIANAAVAPTGSVAGVVGGLAPQALAAQLSSQSSAFAQLGQLYQIQSLLGRASLNVANAGS